MSQKNIEFKATLNTAEMDSKIQALQQKLRTLSSSSNVGDKAKSIYGENSPMTERAQKLQESFNARNLNMLREEFNVRDRMYKSQENNLKQINMLADRAKKGSQEELNLLTEKVKTEEKLLRLQTEQNSVAEKYKSIKGTTEGLSGTGGGQQPPSSGGPTGPQGSEASGGFNPMNFIKGGLAAWATVQVVQRATNIVGDVLRAGLTQARIESEVNQKELSVSGRRDELTGRGLENQFFKDERTKGIADAQGSAAFGTKVKSALGGFAAGSMADLSNGNVGSFLGLYTSDAREKAQSNYARNAQLSSEMDSIQSQKDMDPNKQIAQQYFQQNRGAFLRSQQMSGMNDEAFMGREGFLSRSGGMFTSDQKMSAMQGIFGAGGSTAQGRNAGQALSLQRQFGLQNASGIIGGLSGSQGDGELGSDTVVRRILAEAFSVGLDSSKFSRETEKFLSISTKFVEESGARTTSDMARIGEGQGDFVVGNSMRQIEASSEGRSIFENSLGSGGNQYQKALELSRMRSSKGLSKLTESQRISLANMTPDQIKAGGLEIEAMKVSAGDDFESEALGSKQYSMTATGSQDKRMEDVKRRASGLGVDATNLSDIQSALAKAKASGDTAKVSELTSLLEDSGRSLSEYSTLNNLGGQTGFVKESVFSGAMKFNQKDELSGTMIKAPMPTQEQGIGVLSDIAEASNSQSELTNAMSYMPKYAQSVKDISAISEDLAKALNNLYNRGFGLRDMTTPAPTPSGNMVAPSNGYRRSP